MQVGEARDEELRKINADFENEKVQLKFFN